MRGSKRKLKLKDGVWELRVDRQPKLALHVVDPPALQEGGDPATVEARTLKAELCRLAALGDPSYVTQSLYLNRVDELERANEVVGAAATSAPGAAAADDKKSAR